MGWMTHAWLDVRLDGGSTFGPGGPFGPGIPISPGKPFKNTKKNKQKQNRDVFLCSRNFVFAKITEDFPDECVAGSCHKGGG